MIQFDIQIITSTQNSVFKLQSYFFSKLKICTKQVCALSPSIQWVSMDEQLNLLETNFTSFKS